MSDYAAGDLVMIGPNLPHCWKLEPPKEVQPEASAIVVQFDQAFLGDDFFSKNELQHIKSCFTGAAAAYTFIQGRMLP